MYWTGGAFCVELNPPVMPPRFEHFEHTFGSRINVVGEFVGVPTEQKIALIGVYRAEHTVDADIRSS